MKYIRASSYYQCRICLDRFAHDIETLFVQNYLIHRNKPKQKNNKGGVSGVPLICICSMLRDPFIHIHGNTDLFFTYLRLTSYGGVPEKLSWSVSDKDVILRKNVVFPLFINVFTSKTLVPDINN